MSTPYHEYRYGDGLSFEETRVIEGWLEMFIKWQLNDLKADWRMVKKTINKDIRWRRELDRAGRYPCHCPIEDMCDKCRERFGYNIHEVRYNQIKEELRQANITQRVRDGRFFRGFK